MISIKTGCCLKASSCQAELPLWHRHHNRGCPSHKSVWLAQGGNGSLWRVRPGAGWQAAFAKLDEAFTCYHSVCSTCQFPRLWKQPEQSDLKNVVRGWKRPIRDCNISISYQKKNKKKTHLILLVLWIIMSIKDQMSKGNDETLCFGPTHLALNTHVLSSVACVSDRSGSSREKCPLGVLIMALLLPFAVTISRGGQDKRKAMFHLCCLGISDSVGSKRIETACYCNGGRRGNLDVPPFFALLASFCSCV